MQKYFLLLFSLALVFSNVQSQMKNPIFDWESLPVIRTGVKIKAHSSTNPTGRTMRDFRNLTFQSGEEFEMIHLKAPEGMIVQLWFTSLGWGDNRFGEGRFGQINMYLSDSQTPEFIKDRDLYFQRPTYSMPNPLWDTDGQAQWAFPCLSFKDQCRITSSQNPHWFQITTHMYRDKIYSEVVNPSNIYMINNRIRDYRGRYPGVERGNKVEENTLITQPKSIVELLNWNGPGVIRSFTLKTDCRDGDILDNIWVIVDYGNIEKNAIEVPITVFFGGYVGAPSTNAQGMPAGYVNHEFYSFFPLPFWEGCTISVKNRSEYSCEFTYRIRYNNTNPYLKENAGKFYIQYNDNVEVKAGNPDFVHLGKNGSGTIVGTTANLAGSIEGNFRIYIDDSKTPAIETTGGEDYFCHAFGIDVGLCTPFHGGLYDKIGYRFHIIDYIPFLNSIRLTQDHGHEFQHDRDGIFRSAVFYYWNSVSKISLTDELDIGNKQEEKKHDHTILSGESRLQEEIGRYEGDFEEMFTDQGYWFDGTVAFTANISPENNGVRIRRRINQWAYHQEVAVYADDNMAGIWFEQGSNYFLLKEPDPENFPDYIPDWEEMKAIFRDTEFEIPRNLTEGKSKIRVKLKAIDSKSALKNIRNGFCNGYHYWIYCYEK